MTSGICHSIQMTVWCAGLDETHTWVSSKPAHQTVNYTGWHIPDVVLIQLNLPMMGTWLPETCREQKYTHMKKNCMSSWLFTKKFHSCTGGYKSPTLEM